MSDVPVNPAKVSTMPTHSSMKWSAEDEEKARAKYQEELSKQQSQQVLPLDMSNPEQFHSNPTTPLQQSEERPLRKSVKEGLPLLDSIQKALAPLGEIFAGGGIIEHVTKFILGLALGYVVLQGGKWLMLKLKMSGPADWFKSVKNLTPFSELAEEVASTAAEVVPH